VATILVGAAEECLHSVVFHVIVRHGQECSL
jgi:hypothetical protein